MGRDHGGILGLPPRAHGVLIELSMTRPTAICILCVEEDDLRPELVRLVDVLVQRRLPVEVLVLDEIDPIETRMREHEHAIFVLMRSAALEPSVLLSLRARVVLEGGPGHTFIEHDLDTWHRDLVDEIDEMWDGGVAVLERVGGSCRMPTAVTAVELLRAA